MRRRIPTPLAVGAILLASYAFFWQRRDWNSASRLMLTYALVDRGTIALDGLQGQTNDIARFGGHYYTDKPPGFSLLAVPAYGLAKGVLRLPPHPLDEGALPRWPADYWVTLATSGLLTACAGALLARLAEDLGCGPRRAALVGLAYGLATPAYGYATMSYGHQASSFCLLTAFALLRTGPGSLHGMRAAAAGGLAALAAVIELQVGPVSAILALFLLAQVAARRWPMGAILEFGLGAAVPTAVLLGYNILAFGSPWDIGYFHEVLPTFSKVHSPRNPLGLRTPAWDRAISLLWGRYRGLLFYAPIVAPAPAGWVALWWRRRWGTAAVSAAACAAVFLVNLSYPEWTGGWSVGPRLLVPLLPFAMLPVAGLLAVLPRVAMPIVSALALAGWVLMTLFVGVGTGVPQDLPDPVGQVILRHWSGRPPLSHWPGGRFTLNLVRLVVPGAVGRLPTSWQWLQFMPLIVAQMIGIGWLILRSPDPGRSEGASPP